MSGHIELEPARLGSGDPIIEVRNLTVTFEMDMGIGNVVDHVDVDLRRDEVLGVVGESGSGKSMFASALMNAVVKPGAVAGEVFYHPTDGEPFDVLSLDEEELRQFRWEEVAMVFQGAMSSFNPTLSIGGHFRETIRAHDLGLDEYMEHARRLLREVFLDPDRVLESYPHELSGGMQQRALIALSLVLKPKVLVMDEPTAALDLLMQRAIMRLLQRLKHSYDLTIIFITHDLPLVAELVDRLAVMYAFEFVEIGPKAEMLRDATHPYTRALLKAVPSIHAPLDQMRVIEGDSPDPSSVPSGCSYHPRCPIVQDDCSTREPELFDVGDDWGAACFYWPRSKEEISYSLRDETIEQSYD